MKRSENETFCIFLRITRIKNKNSVFISKIKNNMNKKEEVLTYEILDEYFKEQDRLISEGKIKKPNIVYGFSPEDRKMFNEGLTFEEMWNNVEKNLGMK